MEMNLSIKTDLGGNFASLYKFQHRHKDWNTIPDRFGYWLTPFYFSNEIKTSIFRFSEFPAVATEPENRRHCAQLAHLTVLVASIASNSSQQRYQNKSET